MNRQRVIPREAMTAEVIAGRTIVVRSAHDGQFVCSRENIDKHWRPASDLDELVAKARRIKPRHDAMFAGDNKPTPEKADAFLLAVLDLDEALRRWDGES